MSCALTRGRTEGCRDNQGGVRNVYLLKYIDYPFGSIVLNGQEVVSFPFSNIFKYETQDASYSETITNDEKGVSFNQNLTFTLIKQDLLTTNELKRIQRIDLRYIVEFNDGTFRLGGLYNGAQITSITINSGGSKSDLNGYQINIQGSEEISAPFTTLDVISENNFLLLEDSFYYLLETGDKIILQ